MFLSGVLLEDWPGLISNRGVSHGNLVSRCSDQSLDLISKGFRGYGRHHYRGHEPSQINTRHRYTNRVMARSSVVEQHPDFSFILKAIPLRHGKTEALAKRCEVIE